MTWMTIRRKDPCLEFTLAQVWADPCSPNPPLSASWAKSSILQGRIIAPPAWILLLQAPVLMGLGLWFNNLYLTVCISCSCLFLAEVSFELLQKLFTLLLSVETEGQIIRMESVDITEVLFIFLLMSINKNICLAKEAPWSKQRWSCSWKVEKNKLGEAFSHSRKHRD